MKQLGMLAVVLIMIMTVAACGATTTGGGSADECSSNADCSATCAFDGTWAAGAAGSTSNGGYCVEGSCYCCYALFEIDPDTGADSNGRCMGCDEVGTNCDADANYACSASNDVCLYGY